MIAQINKKYKTLYTTKKRYIVVTGGRGSGKTFAVQDFLVRLLEQVGQGILYTRYTATSVEKTIIPLFTEYIKSITSLSNYRVTKSKVINKRTGSFIAFSGIKTSSGDQTANLKSLPNITTWVIEEGEDFNNEKTFTDIDDSIRTKGMQNRVIWIQNPSSREHFIYKKFFANDQQRTPIAEGYNYIDNDNKLQPIMYQRCTHEDVEHIHTTYLDNVKHLDAKKVKQWHKVYLKDPKKWANKYGGAWVDMLEGAIFEQINWIEEFPENVKRVAYGMDFGFTNDPTTLIKCGLSDGELFAERWLYDYGMTTADINKALTDLGVSKKDVIYADSADPKTIKEVRMLGWRIRGAKKGNDSIRHGINEIKNYEGLNIVNCKYWKLEQNSYIWANDKRTGALTNRPIDSYNHLWDALRYGIQGLKLRKAKSNIRN